MKRDATCIHDVADWQWLCECAARAAKGKRHRSSVQRYFNVLESSTRKVQSALLNARLPEQTYQCLPLLILNRESFMPPPFRTGLRIMQLLASYPKGLNVRRFPAVMPVDPGRECMLQYYMPGVLPGVLPADHHGC